MNFSRILIKYYLVKFLLLFNFKELDVNNLDDITLHDLIFV